MKKGTSKVVSVEVQGTYEGQHGTMINHKYALEDGTVIQAAHKKEKPINIGENVEYEVLRTHEKYGDSGSVKKPNDFKKGVYKKPMLKLVDATRMARSNAYNAIFTVNNSYNESRLTSKDVGKLTDFTLGDISGDIEKFSEEDSLFTSRLSSLNLAALSSGHISYKTASDVVKIAQMIYGDIVR